MNTNSGEKLVRDAIPQIFEARGLTPIVRIATLDEYRRLLRAKLREETDEVDEALNAPPESFDRSAVIDEIADVMEVLYAIATDLGIERDEIERARVAKAERAGRFTKRIVWSGVISADGHESF